MIQRSLVVAVLVLTACGRVSTPTAAPRSTASVTTPATPQPTAGEEGLSGEAHVVCEGARTTVRTPTVEAQPDGVHLLVENPTDEHLRLEYRGAEGSEALGRKAKLGSTRRTVILAPGEARVRCSSTGTDLSSEEGWATFEVLDPHDLWVPVRFVCAVINASAHISVSTKPARGDLRDPLKIARESLPVQPGDEVKAARYPEAVPRVVILVRDGETIASVRYQRPAGVGKTEGAGWVETGRETCAG